MSGEKKAAQRADAAAKPAMRQGAERHTAGAAAAQREAAPLTVLYEDRNLTVCLKPAGVLSEEAPQQAAAKPGGASAAGSAALSAAATGAKASPVSMPSLLRAHWGEPRAAVFPVHRLDTGAAGVMVYARTKPAAAALSAQVQNGGLRKEYRCVCAGVPEPPRGGMRDWLFKDSRKNKVFCVSGARRGAKEALLEYTVLAVRGGDFSAQTAAQPGTAGGADPFAAKTGAGPAEATQPAVCALCAVQLHTGRTHQIRVQFAARRHPLSGDGKYGSREKGPLALWCARLSFTMPGERAPRSFFAPPPAAGAFAAFGAEERGGEAAFAADAPCAAPAGPTR